MRLDADSHSHLAEAPMTRAEAATYTHGYAGYLHGLAEAPRAHLPGYDSGILSIFIIGVLLVSVQLRGGRARLGKLFKDLWSVRRRVNAFDDPTVGEAGVVSAMTFLTCVYEGTLVFSMLRTIGASAAGPGGGFALMPLAVGGAILYYLFQLAAYDIVGYTFTDKMGRMQWIRGFNASQALLGLVLIVPALASLFYPASAPLMCAVGLGAYLVARLVFIIKGFRIFYIGISSLLYFILYLCTLEIAPLVLIARICAPLE
ncbi:MAG: DUF4271 domain-containing protein [Candidatus Amulumruptor caecigallinarius]|nr:DUF4271 domain-containing protein [Candidatus Amulumruptor caecigallinarius]MCM1397249.1 DUF4271 domain-containing protein [Candidatus Amulumruptor caecigallinarius]MCM1453077.1 DUF4271 domain-containing protein [bacterium]